MSADIEEAILLELADGTIQACNPALEKILGFRLEQMQGCRYVDCPWQTIDENGSYFPVETHPAVVALQTGQSLKGVVMGSYQPNGQLVWLRVDAQPLFRANETSPYAVVINFTDITEERRCLRRAAPTQIPQNQTGECFNLEVDRDISDIKQIEAALQESETRFRELVNAMPQFVWVTNANGEVEYVSQQWLEFSGLTLEQTRDSSQLIQLYHPDDAQQAFEKWKVCLATGQPYQVEYRFRRAADNLYYWFLVRAVPIKDEHGQILRWYGTSTEISDRKQIEADLRQSQESLRKSEERLQLALKAAGMFVWERDCQTGWVVCSEAALEVCSFLEGTVDDFLALTHPDDLESLQQVVQQSVIDGKSFSLDYRVLSPDGQVHWVSTWGSGYLGLDGQLERVIGVSVDITERKRMEEILQESEERFRQLAENIDLVFWITEMPERRSSYVSPAYERLWGLNRQCIYDEQQTWVNLIHPEDRKAIERAFLEQAAAGEFDQEYRIVLPDGRIRWVRDRCFPLKDESGNVYRFTGIAEDITNRKQAQEVLHSALQKLNSHVENTPMAVIEWDASLIVRRWSGAAEQMFGWQAEEVQGIYISDLNIVYEEDIPAVADVARRILTGEEPQIISHNRNYTKNGSVIHCIWYNSTLTDASGQVTSVLSLVLDVTEQKRTEQALRESEEKFRLITENARDLICIVNEAGRYIYVSPAYERVLGYSTETLLTLSVIDLTHPEDLAAIEDWHNAKSCEFRVRKADGSWLWMEACSNQITTQAGNFVIGVARDISDRRQAEAEREQLLQREQAAREQAETANRIKDEFLAVLSHELRSPLNPILGWSKLLQTRQFEREKMVQGLATIERNAKLQLQLIEDLLDISRIIRGKLVLNIAPVSLEPIILSALETVRLAAQIKAIQVETHLAPIVGQVSGDAARLQQIIWNLLSNAIKFTPNGGRVEIRLEQLDSHAQIQVIDTGKGINPEFLPYVFEYFRQEDATTTRQFGGLGLGLAIARQIVEMHDGRIWAESPGEGKGTTFTVQLPLHKPDASRIEDAVINASLLSNSSSFPLEGIRILVVDDDTDAREYFTSLLKQEQAIVTSAASAIEALQSLKKFQPDVLLCDIGMPVIDGYMLLKQIRMLPPQKGGQIPAIALTAYAGESNQKLALAAGFQLHIAKPAAPDEIVAAVNCLIESIRKRLR